MGEPKYTVEQMAEALHKSRGTVTGAADFLQASHVTVLKYINEYPELQEIRAYYKHRRTDQALHGMDYYLERKAPWAIAMQLKDSKDGQAEGYGNIQKIEGNGEKGEIVITIKKDGTDIVKDE